MRKPLPRGGLRRGAASLAVVICGACAVGASGSGGASGAAGEAGEGLAGGPPILHARGEFFGASIELNARVLPAFPDRDPGDRPERGGRPGNAGEGGGPSRGGRGRRGDGFAAGGPTGGLAEGRSNIRAQNAAPKRLDLALTNRGDIPVVVEVIDFKSAFGNFAVRPARIAIAPGETVHAEPMLSRLEIYDQDLPLEIRLIRGNDAEEQVLAFVPEFPPATGPASAPAS